MCDCVCAVSMCDMMRTHSNAVDMRERMNIIVCVAFCRLLFVRTTSKPLISHLCRTHILHVLKPTICVLIIMEGMCICVRESIKGSICEHTITKTHKRTHWERSEVTMVAMSIISRKCESLVRVCVYVCWYAPQCWWCACMMCESFSREKKINNCVSSWRQWRNGTCDTDFVMHIVAEFASGVPVGVNV